MPLTAGHNVPYGDPHLLIDAFHLSQSSLPCKILLTGHHFNYNIRFKIFYHMCFFLLIELRYKYVISD